MASLHSLARRVRVRSAARTASSRRLSSVVLLALLVVAAIGAGPVIALSSAGSLTHLTTAGPASAGSTAAEGAPRSARAQAALLAGNSSELLQAGSVAHDITSPASLVEPAVAKANQERAQRAAQLASKRAATHRASTTRTVHRTTTRSTTYHYAGTNHVWIPSLGINRAVYWFPCSRTTDPGMVVYRWGCAGTNNVYLMAHAGGPFYALNRAYYDGRLRVGMKVVYADGSGRVHTYSVIWWRVVRPTTAASWAWASLSRPSMTLQTFLGANSEYRLMVRLIQVS
jgi:hypothetical protein